VRHQRHSIMESLIINGGFFVTGATASRRYSVAKVREPLSAIATATINGSQLVILCTIYLTLNGENCWRWQLEQKLELRSDISHLHLPSNPKQINCVVLCKKIKQTNQTALMLFPSGNTDEWLKESFLSVMQTNDFVNAIKNLKT
jgi:hypothetical protein